MRTSVRNKKLKRLQKYLNKKRKRGTRKQCGGFLNKYDSAHAEWDTANQAMKVLDTLAPKEIVQASKEIDKITEARIRQVINDGGLQIQKIAPQIVRGAIEDVYKTPFRLLGNLGKKKFAQVKRTIWIKWTNKNENNNGQNLSWLCNTLYKWRKKTDRFWEMRYVFSANARPVLEGAN